VRRRAAAFTLVELLVVMVIILILAGLILAIASYVQKKGKRSRTAVEIEAISNALENYKQDNGIYPSSNGLDARTDYYPNSASKAVYEAGSQTLYVALSADTNRNRTIEANEKEKSYFSFKPNMLSPNDQNSVVSAIRDPFGNSYGYSTASQSAPNKGYNPTFDLWSTGGDKDPGETDQQYLTRWIKNW
jgi:prepilin-type N-terminal cleavage/methylation domain-containing protein